MGNSIKMKAKTKVKAKPIKAGSTHRGDTGGIFTAKVVAIVKKKKGHKDNNKKN